MISFLSFFIVFLPLLGSIVLLLYPNRNDFKSSLIANITIGISFLFSLLLLIRFFFHNDSETSIHLFTWLRLNNFIFEFAFLVDSLTVIMSFIVTFISFFVHIFSIGYMKGDSSFNRFLIYTNFFTFSMLFIVYADNFLQLFIGWELVGLSSYLLIGFWYRKESAIKANLKAFIVNRVGDIGLLLGVIMIFVFSNTLNYDEFFIALTSLTDVDITILGFSIDLLPLIALLLFIGASAKSAQIPLHFWLPDSMEGPTPISALIHAATMVTAGIFMVARLSPLYDLSLYVLDIILYIGVLTAFLMGLVALIQNDIKRIIAYSTISQLGYMTVALGASFYSFAIFHLLTHAFFKALLFLCAGSIILKCHHEQDVTKMGGLRKFMPYTYYTFIVAALALIGFPLTSGFFSKDIIIDIFKYKDNYAVYYILVFGILITTLYTAKIFFNVFFGENKMNIKDTENLEHSDVILIPLVSLAIPSLFIGIALFDNILFSGFFSTSITDNSRILLMYDNFIHSSISFMFNSLFSLNFLSLLTGLLLSYFIYYKRQVLNINIFKRSSRMYSILSAEYGFKSLSDTHIPNLFKNLSRVMWKTYDELFIDKLIVNGIANKIHQISLQIRKIQTGFIYHYAFVMIISLMTLLWIFFGL